ncbi:MAG: hypothetical protein ABR500_04980 [Dermatophilaceae bacterium]|nr:hypothetical protein [Intrasporangiaceae bacterium]
MSELTWGLDVSTNRAKTAPVAVDWSIRHVDTGYDIAGQIASERGVRAAMQEH